MSKLYKFFWTFVKTWAQYWRGWDVTRIWSKHAGDCSRMINTRASESPMWLCFATNQNLVSKLKKLWRFISLSEQIDTIAKKVILCCNFFKTWLFLFSSNWLLSVNIEQEYILNVVFLKIICIKVFACPHVCVLHVCLVFRKTRRGHWLL